MLEQLQDPRVPLVASKALVVAIIMVKLQVDNRLPSTSSSWIFAGIW
jgi:hypothetical protein